MTEAISRAGRIKHTCTHTSAGMVLFAVCLDGRHTNKAFRMLVCGERVQSSQSHTAALKHFTGKLIPIKF